MLTRAEARDEMMSLFKTAWDAQATPPVVLWPDVEGDVPSGDPASPWARVTLLHNDGDQVAWGPGTQKRYEHTGLIVIQIFTPHGGGLSLADQLATIAIQAFRGKTTAGGAFFPRVRAREVGESGPWSQTNVVVDFSYDEVQ